MNSLERSKILAATQTKNAYQFVRGGVAPESTIIAIGGGKGGIGKSFVSSSVAIFLANQGHETYLVDLDLGGANLHTTLGEGLPKLGINEFVSSSSLTLPDIAVKTAHPNLKLISGSSDQMDVADINEFQRTHLMSSLFKLKTKYIVLDLSAGTHHTTLDFFLMAQHKICVFTPEPSSMKTRTAS